MRNDGLKMPTFPDLDPGVLAGCLARREPSIADPAPKGRERNLAVCGRFTGGDEALLRRDGLLFLFIPHVQIVPIFPFIVFIIFIPYAFNAWQQGQGQAFNRQTEQVAGYGGASGHVAAGRQDLE